jgi:hypothetical protein
MVCFLFLLETGSRLGFTDMRYSVLVFLNTTNWTERKEVVECWREFMKLLSDNDGRKGTERLSLGILNKECQQ